MIRESLGRKLKRCAIEVAEMPLDEARYSAHGTCDRAVRSIRRTDTPGDAICEADLASPVSVPWPWRPTTQLP